jgi:hypothetical protein
MRVVLIAALVSLGVGLFGLSPSLAAPASAFAKAANFNETVDQVHWRRYHHRHWWWRHRHHHRWY